MAAMKTHPDGAVDILTREAPLGERGTSIQLWDLGPLYERLGARSDAFARWEKHHGYCTGVTPEGEAFLPDFPIFSTVAWMNIDWVLLSGSEVLQLIEECERAERQAEGTPEAELFRRIGDLGRRAATQGSQVRFGPG
jgi:hypothetical protein